MIEIIWLTFKIFFAPDVHCDENRPPRKQKWVLLE